MTPHSPEMDYASRVTNRRHFRVRLLGWYCGAIVAVWIITLLEGFYFSFYLWHGFEIRLASVDGIFAFIVEVHPNGFGYLGYWTTGLISRAPLLFQVKHAVYLGVDRYEWRTGGYEWVLSVSYVYIIVFIIVAAACYRFFYKQGNRKPIGR